MKGLVLALALCCGLSAHAAETLQIDETHSAVLFHWSHLGISNPVARFERMDGRMILDRNDPTKSSISLSLPIDGLRTGVEPLDRRLKGDEFLDGEKYPVITFQSTGVTMTGAKTFKLSGDLSVHGVTRPVTLTARVNGIARNGFSGALMAGFEADAVIRRSDFGVSKYVPAVSDRLVIHITLHAEPAASAG